METLILEAKKREIKGKKVNNLRKEGLLPAILYGKEISPQKIVVNKKDFQKVFKVVGENTLIDLKIDDKETRKVLISDPQIDPVTDDFIHVDFHQVKLTEKITAEVPLEFVNEEEAPAIKELEGTLVKEKDTIQVECLPQDIPHSIEVNTLLLKTFDDIIRISDLRIPDNVKVLDEPEEVVALVIPPRSEEELKELEEEVVEDVEQVGEVEKKEKEEEAEAKEGISVEEGEEKTPETGAEESPAQGKRE